MGTNESLLVGASLGLATWASVSLRAAGSIGLLDQRELRKRSRRGTALALGSVALMAYAGTALFRSFALPRTASLGSVYPLTLSSLWLLAFGIGRLRMSEGLVRGPIQTAIVMTLVAWLIARERAYSAGEVALFLALTIWVSFRTKA